MCYKNKGINITAKSKFRSTAFWIFLLAAYCRQTTLAPQAHSEDVPSIIYNESLKRQSMAPLIPEIARCYEEIYLRFLSGKLIYRPSKGSDRGKVELPIAIFANPLEGTFDLSSCGDAGQYLSINVGYRKRKNPSNQGKVEIWLAPKFLIEKELNATAGHFREIISESKWPETAQIGIFWTWGDWDNLRFYDHLTTNSFEQLANNNLFEKYLATPNKRGKPEIPITASFPSRWNSDDTEYENFYVCF